MASDRPSDTTIPCLSRDEDGLTFIHWRGQDEGVMLIVQPDGEWSCSVKQKGGSYAMSDIPFDPANGLPTEAIEMLRRLCNG